MRVDLSSIGINDMALKLITDVVDLGVTVEVNQEGLKASVVVEEKDPAVLELLAGESSSKQIPWPAHHAGSIVLAMIEDCYDRFAASRPELNLPRYAWNG